MRLSLEINPGSVMKPFAYWMNSDLPFCIAHGSGLPLMEKIFSDFIYLRLHGGEVLYGSNYSDKELKQWAEKIQEWRKKDKTVFTYFIMMLTVSLSITLFT